MRALMTALLSILAACGPRGELTFDATVARIGAAPEIFVGTSREADPETGDFGIGRRSDVSFARYVVQVPPGRAPGTIAWPPAGSRPDPARHFVTVEREIYAGRADFGDDLRAALAALPAEEREVRVFVHGFNTTFAEGLYRLAQLDEDLGLPGVSVLYSWPSRGRPLAYVADRDSAVFARDSYETFLTDLVAAGARRIVLVGHSMGGVVTIETLRQMAIGGNRAVLDRVTGVILLAPDVDVDVFEAAARRIGKLPQPFYIFTSDKDRALSISARLAGRSRRLGNIDAPQKLAELDITLVDTTAFSVRDGHFNPGNSPALISILQNMSDIDEAFRSDQTSNADLFTQTVERFKNARVVTVGPPVGRPGER